MLCSGSTADRPLLLLLLLLLPRVRSSAQAQDFPRLNDIILRAHRQQSINTVLLLHGQRSVNCPLDGLRPSGLPTLRLDEGTELRMRQDFNSRALAMLCMAGVADSLLLARLAQVLHGMRETRIVVVLVPDLDARLAEELLEAIVRQADSHSFINLIVLRSAQGEHANWGYRLKPFPQPSFQPIANWSEEPIFPKLWRNFEGKTAAISPDLFMPRSILGTDPRTGQLQLYGSSDTFIREFAARYNIELKLMRPLSEMALAEQSDTLNVVRADRIDIPRRPIVYSVEELEHYEISSGSGTTKFFIIVPCRREMTIGDVYSGLKNFFVLLGCSYSMFALIDTLLSLIAQWVHRCGQRIPYAHLLVNLRAFAGVLGLSMHRGRRARSGSSPQQFLMVLCVFGLVLNTFFNASLSTLLTKHPQNKQIQTFEELRQSGLKVIFDVNFNPDLETKVEEANRTELVPNRQYEKLKRCQHLLLTLNSSYAHVTIPDMWHILRDYQQSHRMNILCKSKHLELSGLMLVGFQLRKNSVFCQALNEFLLRSLAHGLQAHWKRKSGLFVMGKMHPLLKQRFVQASEEFNALNVHDLIWLWKMLGITCGVAVFAFIMENCAARWQWQPAGRGRASGQGK